jgi:hypothetical protein
MDLAGRHLIDIPQATSFDAPAHASSAGVVYAEATLAE